MKNNTNQPNQDNPKSDDFSTLLEDIETTDSQHRNFQQKVIRHFAEKLDGIHCHATTEAEKTSQLQIKFNALLRQFEEITAQFIAQRVELPWIKDMVCIYDALNPVSTESCDNDSVDALLQKMEQRLSDADTTLITPTVGDPFNATTQQAIVIRPTADSKRHGQISSVFSRGISRNGRPLRHAHVSVFRYEVSTTA